MGGSSGSSGGESVTTIRYADYIESVHNSFLNTVAALAASNASSCPLDSAEFGGTLETAFFTSGYTIASFPSMFDMFGKFMAGLDIETLFDQMLEHDVEATGIDNRVSSYSQELDDDIEENSWPRLAAGMRDINCVTSSNFVVAQALLEAKKATLLTKYDTELRVKMISIAAQRWQVHLDWNKNTVAIYGELYKLYYSLLMDLDNQDQTRKAKYALWPFTIYEYERLALGALTGAVSSKTSGIEGSEASTTQKVLGGALAGASIGATVGGAYGAIIGGVIGGVAGLFM